MEYFFSIIIYYTLKLILPNLQSMYPSMQYPCLCTVFYLLTVGFLVSQSDFYFFSPQNCVRLWPYSKDFQSEWLLSTGRIWHSSRRSTVPTARRAYIIPIHDSKYWVSLVICNSGFLGPSHKLEVSSFLLHHSRCSASSQKCSSCTKKEKGSSWGIPGR